jgi:hypothetical protein
MTKWLVGLGLKEIYQNPPMNENQIHGVDSNVPGVFIGGYYCTLE